MDDRPSPGKIRTDNGPKFRSHRFRSRCEGEGIRLDFIEPGEPHAGRIIERFNGGLRDAYLGANWFRNRRYSPWPLGAAIVP